MRTATLVLRNAQLQPAGSGVSVEAPAAGEASHHVKYLLAQDMEQNRLVPLNWLAGAKLLQYSHLSTAGREGQRSDRVRGA